MCELVPALLARSNPEVTMWDEPRPPDLRERLEPTEHCLSSAARIFKGHALSAASTDQMVTATESFRGTRSSDAPLLRGTP